MDVVVAVDVVVVVVVAAAAAVAQREYSIEDAQYFASQEKFPRHQSLVHPASTPENNVVLTISGDDQGVTPKHFFWAHKPIFFCHFSMK